MATARASSYRLLPSSFVPIATHQPAVCFAQILYRVSLSFITSSMITSRQLLQAGAHIVQRASFHRRQPMRRERLPLGPAEGPPGAARLKKNVRTLLHFSKSRWWPLLDNERTLVVSIFLGDTQAHLPRRMFNFNILYLLIDFFSNIFSENLRSFLEITPTNTFRCHSQAHIL